MGVREEEREERGGEEGVLWGDGGREKRWGEGEVELDYFRL